MKMYSGVLALMVVNLALVGFQFANGAAEQKEPVAGVLRGHALELVDDKGQVRAEIRICPAQPNLKMPDGSVGYPEAVLLRLITSKNGPNVKLVTTEDGSGLVLGGDSGHVQILSRGKEDPFINLATNDNRQKALKLDAR